MLAGITNFLFGESSSNSPTPTPSSTCNAIDETDKENEYATNGNNLEDEGWIIIDVDKRESNENELNGNENDLMKTERTNYVPNLCNFFVPATTTTNNNDNTPTAINVNEMHNITTAAAGNSNNNNTTTSSTSSNSNNGTMEGSWFVTPPPCFTHPNTFAMESSPLEDILIEHPSISVFCPRPEPKGHHHLAHNHHHHHYHNQKQSTANCNENALNKPQSNRAKKQAKVSEKLETQQPRSVTITELSLKTGLLSDISNIVAPMQKASDIATQKYLKKTYMDRQNKVACRLNGRPSRQKKLTATINGYSVNRKMC